MAQISKGDTFTNGEQVTGSRLNQLVDSAILLNGSITEQTSISANTVDSADKVLIYDASADALRKASVSDILGSGLPVTVGAITSDTISATSINGKTNKDVFIIPNDGVSVTGKTFSSIDGLTVAVSSLTHGLLVGQYVQMTCSNANYSGLFKITSASTDSFGYILNATVSVASGTCSYIKKASLPVTGNVSITGNEDVGGNLTVSGDVYFKSTSAIKIPVGTTAERPALAITGQLRYNTTTTHTEVYNGTTWEVVGGSPFDATGGNKIIAPDTTVVSASFSSSDGFTIVVTNSGHSVSEGQTVKLTTSVSGYSGNWVCYSTTSTTFTLVSTVSSIPNSGTCTYQKAGNYKIHIFTSDGTFNVGDKDGNIEVLAVGGGGGCGNTAGYQGGGGGAVVYCSYYKITAGQTITVGIGVGGATASNGTASVFGTITAGGGFAGTAYSGGSSGIGSMITTSYIGGTSQPYKSGNIFPYLYGSSGGGGSAGNGTNGYGRGPFSGSDTYGIGGNGGNGTGSDISGIVKSYGGGGGGKGYDIDGQIGNGNEVANSGGGGTNGVNSGAGFSGIIIVRYPYFI
jgi:hypothetical protein